MNLKKTALCMSILFVSLFSISGCSHQSQSFAFHTKSTYIDHSDSSWSEPIYVEKGQTIEATYSVTMSKGTWEIWFTRFGEIDPRYQYSATDRDRKGWIRYTVTETGKYTLHFKSTDFTGSREVTLRVVK